MQDPNNLTKEEKESLVGKINDDLDKPEEKEGNTEIKTLADDEKLNEEISKLTPKELHDRALASSYRSMALLDQLLPKLSKKNLVKLLIATLSLPEEGADLNFGGTQKDKETANTCFAFTQMARNVYVHVVGTKAMAQAKLQKEKEEAAKKAEDKKESNDE